MLAALEDAVNNHIVSPSGNGSHPYAAGLRWDLDMSKAKGQRFTNLQVRSKSTGAWSAIDTAKTYVLAKNTLARPVRADYSHQKVITTSGVTLP